MTQRLWGIHPKKVNAHVFHGDHDSKWLTSRQWEFVRLSLRFFFFLKLFAKRTLRADSLGWLFRLILPPDSLDRVFGLTLWTDYSSWLFRPILQADFLCLKTNETPFFSKANRRPPAFLHNFRAPLNVPKESDSSLFSLTGWKEGEKLPRFGRRRSNSSSVETGATCLGAWGSDVMRKYNGPNVGVCDVLRLFESTMSL